MKTKITDLLGMSYPILCGGLYGLSEAKLVSSVCNAGGFAFLSSNHLGSPKALREQIRQTRELTDKPFGVNISLLKESKTNFTDDYIDVIIEEDIPAVETAGNNPVEYIKRLKKENRKVLHKAVTAKHAQKAEAAGADGVILVGYAAGGHPGLEEVGLFVNLPETVRAVTIPVIAAGGICTGEGMACAFLMGAQGILMGTAFAATQESPFHQNIKARIVQAKSTDTVVVFKSVRNSFRCLKNDLTAKVMDLEKNNAPAKEIFSYLEQANPKNGYLQGDGDHILIPIGQAAGLIDRIVSCEELIQNIMLQYEACLKNLSPDKTIF